MRMSAFVIVFGTVFKYNNDKRNGFCIGRLSLSQLYRETGYNNGA